MSIFFVACLLGILSAGTMANGVVALPLAFVMSCFLPFTRGKRCSLLALAIIIPLIYFWGYSQPPGHGSLTKTLMSDPIGVLRYAMIYIGSPFYVIAQKSKIALLIAEAFGGVLVLVSIFSALVWLFSRHKSPFVGGLLFFILFIGGTAVGTAGGRLIFGLAQATSERYTTPAVMAWAAMFVVVFSYVKSTATRFGKLGGFALFGVSLLLLFYQSKAVRLNHEINFERNVAALAASLGVGDANYLKQLFPSVEYILSVQEKASQRQLGYSTVSPFAGNLEGLGNKVPNFPKNACQGVFDQVESLPLGNGYVRVVGWVIDPLSKTIPEKLMAVDENDQVIGYVLTGKPRKDLGNIFGQFAKRAGFVGYVKTTAQGRNLRLLASNDSCSMSGKLPQLVFERSEDLSKHSPSLKTGALVTLDHFNGTVNVPAESAPGSTIYSSYVNGDADVGFIKLRVKNGDLLMYKTGPVSERQILKSSVADVSLPLSGDWSTLRFVGFPDDELHEITIEDAGNGWGEWTAIALRNQ